jgi:uncharacterized membrane protein YgcG
MPDDQYSANVIISGQDQLSPVLNQASTSVTNFVNNASRALQTQQQQLAQTQQNMQRAAQSAQSAVQGHAGALLGLSAPMQGLLKLSAEVFSADRIREFATESLRNFGDMQEGMLRLQQATGATNQQMKALGDELENLERTGSSSMRDLRDAFEDFKEMNRLTVEDAEKQFPKVAMAAQAAGTQVDSMVKLWTAAAHNLKVPLQEIPDVIDGWMKTIPTSMLGAFSAAIPRLTADLNLLGLGGKQSAFEIGAAYKELSISLGNPTTALRNMEQLINSIAHGSSPQLTFALRESQQAGEGFAGLLERIYTLVPDDAWDDAAQMGRIAKQLHIPPQVIRSLKEWHENYTAMNEDVEEAEKARGTAAERYAQQQKTLHAAIQDFLASMSQFSTEVGRTLNDLGASRGLHDLAKILSDVKDTLQGINDLVEGQPINWSKFLGVPDLETMFARMEATMDRFRATILPTTERKATAAAATTHADELQRQLNERTGRPSEEGTFAEAARHADEVKKNQEEATRRSQQQVHDARTGDWLKYLSPWSDVNKQAFPRHAEGAIVDKPEIAMIGEAGPEAVIPLQGPGDRQAAEAALGGRADEVMWARIQSMIGAQRKDKAIGLSDADMAALNARQGGGGGGGGGGDGGFAGGGGSSGGGGASGGWSGSGRGPGGTGTAGTPGSADPDTTFFGTGTSDGDTGDYGRIADAIGRQEGYGVAGAIPTVQNNPGDLKWGPFAQAHGATGPGRGGHAIFPDAASGRNALIALLQTKGKGQSIAQIGSWWAEDKGWGAAVAKYAGLSPDYVPKAGTGTGKPELGAGNPLFTMVNPNTGGPIDVGVLQQAAQIAGSTGSHQAVYNFIKSQGMEYTSGENCAEFVTAVLARSQHLPPGVLPASVKGDYPSAASYMHYGTAVDAAHAQPGDVLARHDAGGSHAMIVGPGGYDPKTGRLNIVAANTDQNSWQPVVNGKLQGYYSNFRIGHLDTPKKDSSGGWSPGKGQFQGFETASSKTTPPPKPTPAPAAKGGFKGGGIEFMAAGGVVNEPTLAMIGEAGPEMVVPLGGGGGGYGGGMEEMPGRSFYDDVKRMTFEQGATPKDVQSYFKSHGVDVSEPTCGQFMAAMVRDHGGTVPAGYPAASNWRKQGQPGYSDAPGAINWATWNRGTTGEAGSHIGAVQAIKDEKGNIVAYDLTGANQGKNAQRNVVVTDRMTPQQFAATFTARHELPGDTSTGPASPSYASVAGGGRAAAGVRRGVRRAAEGGIFGYGAQSVADFFTKPAGDSADFEKRAESVRNTSANIAQAGLDLAAPEIRLGKAGWTIGKEAVKAGAGLAGIDLGAEAAGAVERNRRGPLEPGTYDYASGGAPPGNPLGRGAGLDDIDGIRAKLEQPIRMNIAAPNLAPVRRSFARQESRRRQESETRDQRWKHHGDIGFQ